MPTGNPESPDEPFAENEMIMNTFGEIGWELVAVYKDHMIFKRAVL